MNGPSLMWDLDGTLLDSYGVIVSTLHDALLEQGVDYDPEKLLRFVTRSSVGKWLTAVSDEYGVPKDTVRERYLEMGRERYREIALMPHAREILERTGARGAAHCVYTHRDETAKLALENLGILSHFTEILTTLDGFPYKPCPDAVLYLMEKHHMDRERTFYIGDRTIDIDCACNAGIRGILYLQEGSCVTPTGREYAVVRDLLEVEELVAG